MDQELEHLRAEVARLRRRVTLNEDDVIRSGVTFEQLDAWLLDHGHERCKPLWPNIAEWANPSRMTHIRVSDKSPADLLRIVKEILWLVPFGVCRCQLDVLDMLAAFKPTCAAPQPECPSVGSCDST